MRYFDAGGGIGEFDALRASGGRFDPTVEALLNALPSPEKINDPRFGDGLNTGGYTFLMRNNLDRQHVTGKLDWNISSTQALGAKFLWMNEHRDYPSFSNNYETRPAYFGHNIRRVGTGYWRWNPTAQTTNEVRGGMNLAPADFFVHSEPDLPLVQTTLFTGPVNTSRPQTRTDDTYTLQENFTAVLSAHTIQAGWHLQRFHTRFYDEALIRPTYSLLLEVLPPNPPPLPDMRHCKFGRA